MREASSRPSPRPTPVIQTVFGAAIVIPSSCQLLLGCADQFAGRSQEACVSHHAVIRTNGVVFGFDVPASIEHLDRLGHAKAVLLQRGPERSAAWMMLGV